VRPAGKRRVLGLRALIEDVVEHGSRAVERVHRTTAERTFTVLELIPPIAEPARLVREVHGAVLTGVYASIRGVNRAVGAVLAVAIEELVESTEPSVEPARPTEPERP
jgi:hypothetical protein